MRNLFRLRRIPQIDDGRAIAVTIVSEDIPQISGVRAHQQASRRDNDFPDDLTVFEQLDTFRCFIERQDRIDNRAELVFGNHFHERHQKTLLEPR